MSHARKKEIEPPRMRPVSSREEVAVYRIRWDKVALDSISRRWSGVYECVHIEYR